MTADELAPGLVALVDDLGRVLLVLRLAGEREVVLGLAIGNLVDAASATNRSDRSSPHPPPVSKMKDAPEPLVRRANKTREVALNVLNVIQLARKRVLNVNDNDLPVGLALVEKSHDAKNLDLLDLANIADLLTDLADVERVVVTLGLGLGVHGRRVLPGL